MTVRDNRTRLDAQKLNKIIFLRKNLDDLKRSDEDKRAVDGNQKRKSTDNSDSDKDEGEQQTPSSILKKQRVGSDEVAFSVDELSE